MNFYYFLSWKESEFVSYVNRNFGKEIEETGAGGKTLRVDTDKGTIICIFVNRKDYKKKAVLVHECVHAACWTLESRGVDDEESLAYLTEAIFREAN